LTGAALVIAAERAERDVAEMLTIFVDGYLKSTVSYVPVP